MVEFLSNFIVIPNRIAQLPNYLVAIRNSPARNRDTHQVVVRWRTYIESSCRLSTLLSCQGRIAHYAFAECTSLVNVLIPAGCVTVSDRCFSFDTSLTGVRFPDILTLIGEFSFWKCVLKGVALPDDCEVAKYAFSECKALMQVMFGTGCTGDRRACF
jgi:hypothetical protein